jgi:hypothetical protein
MAQGFLIGETLLGQIKDTVKRVQGEPVVGNMSRIETRFESIPAASSKTFCICTFTGAWAINGEKTVTFRGVTTTPNTVSATNLFFDLPSNGTSTCAIAKEGTAWYLVQDVHTQVTVITGATLGTAGIEFTRAVVTVVATATASVTTITTTAC